MTARPLVHHVSSALGSGKHCADGERRYPCGALFIKCVTRATMYVHDVTCENCRREWAEALAESRALDEDWL